jgi:hypothetical protein
MMMERNACESEDDEAVKNCFRFHNQQRITPIAAPSTCQNPKAPVGIAQARPRIPMLQHH